MRRYLCAPKRQRGAGARGAPTPPTEAPQSCLRERTWRRTGGEAPSSSCRSEVLREGGGGCLLPSRAPATSWRRHAPAARACWWGRGPLRWPQRSGPAMAFGLGRSACAATPHPLSRGCFGQRDPARRRPGSAEGGEGGGASCRPRAAPEQPATNTAQASAQSRISTQPHVAVERALSGPLPATSLAGPGRVEIFNLSSRKSEGVSRSHSGLLAIGSQSSGILRWDHVEARHQSQPMVGPCRGRRSTSRSLPCWLEEYDLFQFYRRRSIVRSTTGVISSTRPRLYLFVLVIYHTPSRRCGMRRATSLSSSPPHVRPPKRLRVSSCGLRAATGGHIAHARLNSLQVGQEGVGGDERGA